MSELQQQINSVFPLLRSLNDNITRQLKAKEYALKNLDAFHKTLDSREIDYQARAREYGESSDRYRKESVSYTPKINDIGTQISQWIRYFNSNITFIPEQDKSNIHRIIIEADRLCFLHEGPNQIHDCKTCDLYSYHPLALSIIQEELLNYPTDKGLIDHFIHSLLTIKGSSGAIAYLENQITSNPNDKFLPDYLQFLYLSNLESKEPKNVLSALNYLETHGNNNAIKPLKDYYDKGTYGGFQIVALKGLVNIQGKESAGFLKRALTNSDSKVRAYAAQVLGDLGSSECIDDLEKLYQSEADGSVREIVFNSLRKLDHRPRSLVEKISGRRSWAK